MKIIKKNRSFKTGFGESIIIKDCARIKLDNNEQVTFQNKNFLYDFCKKDWGYYSTPSINKRLKNSGFEVYLIENLIGDIYLWSVEKNKINKFLDYLKKENQKIIVRLDNINSVEGIIKNIKKNYKEQCTCPTHKKNSKNSFLLYNYLKRPKKEPDYKISNYKRKIFKCNICGHCNAVHNINTKKFYSQDYSIISHGKLIEKKFKQILGLKKKSDNYHRVRRFLEFFEYNINSKIKLLDVGSGLSVFLHAMSKKVNWDIEGIEPDLNFVDFVNYCRWEVELLLLFLEKMMLNLKLRLRLILLFYQNVQNQLQNLSNTLSILSHTSLIGYFL